MNAKYRSDAEWRARRLAKDAAAKAKKHAEYRAAHPRVLLTSEERIEHVRESFRKHSRTPVAQERNRVNSRNHRALKKLKAAGAPITKDVWRGILAACDYHCHYCNVRTEFLELDHIVPLSRGGAHSLENIVPACRACNTSKNNKLLAEWKLPTAPQKVVHPRGSGRAWKLTDEQVEEIILRRAAGESGRALAKEFSITDQYVSHLFVGRTPRSKKAKAKLEKLS